MKLAWIAASLLVGCSVATEPEAMPATVEPVVTFVGVCERPAVWWLLRDRANLDATGIWLFLATDSVTVPAVIGAERFDWYELDSGTGRALQAGTAPLDSLGAARVVATCL